MRTDLGVMPKSRAMIDKCSSDKRRVPGLRNS